MSGKALGVNLPSGASGVGRRPRVYGETAPRAREGLSSRSASPRAIAIVVLASCARRSSSSSSALMPSCGPAPGKHLVQNQERFFIEPFDEQVTHADTPLRPQLTEKMGR